MAYGTVKADVIQSDTANVPPQFNGGNGVQVGTLCRAWVNFNGTGTVAIRASFNVSSITDRGTGTYTINLTNALPDANMAVTFGGQVGGAGRGFYSDAAPTTSAVYVYCTTASALVDPSDVWVAVFR